MNKILCFEKEFTIEQFIKMQICMNGGTQSFAFKDNLIGLCKQKGLSVKNNMSKDELFELLISNGFEYQQFADMFGVGVSSQTYQHAFDISHKDVKRLEKNGTLKVVGSYRFREWGRYNYAPLYDIYQYARFSKADIAELLEDGVIIDESHKK